MVNIEQNDRAQNLQRIRKQKTNKGVKARKWEKQRAGREQRRSSTRLWNFPISKSISQLLFMTLP